MLHVKNLIFQLKFNIPINILDCLKLLNLRLPHRRVVVWKRVLEIITTAVRVTHACSLVSN